MVSEPIETPFHLLNSRVAAGDGRGGGTGAAPAVGAGIARQREVSMEDMVQDTADRLFASHAEAAFASLPAASAEGAAPWQAALWEAIEEMGFPLALLTEAEGGFDLSPTDAAALVRLAAAHALPVPLAETMLANLLLARAGLPLAEGPAALVTGIAFDPAEGGVTLRGTATEVAWGRAAQTLVALGDDGRVARLGAGWSVSHGQNLASEPRDGVTLDATIAAADVGQGTITPEVLFALGAIFRAQGLAGALEAVLDQCIGYTTERIQFGRALSAFQVIQQNLAAIAGQVMAARAGADMAAAALPLLDGDREALLRTAAAAKLRAGEAASQVAWVAHQVHGAIGFTREFRLHALTTRLWAWRDEYGPESLWAERLGAEVLSRGAAAYWPMLTETAGDQQ